MNKFYEAQNRYHENKKKVKPRSEAEKQKALSEIQKIKSILGMKLNA